VSEVGFAQGLVVLATVLLSSVESVIQTFSLICIFFDAAMLTWDFFRIIPGAFFRVAGFAEWLHLNLFAH
jgi:hypothetical protein